MRESLADLVALQQAARALIITMSTSPDPGPVNGHESLSGDEQSVQLANGNPTDSDLSDTQPAAVSLGSPESADAVGSPDAEPDFAREEQDEPSDPSDNDAQDDADFDAAGSPASAQSNDSADRAASASTRPAAKRKAALAIEDEYMRENPELYGLRRSVRYSSLPLVLVANS